MSTSNLADTTQPGADSDSENDEDAITKLLRTNAKIFNKSGDNILQPTNLSFSKLRNINAGGH